MRVTTMLTAGATKDITNDDVKKQYAGHVQKFADYVRAEYKIREKKDLPDDVKPLIEAYIDHLRTDGKSADTIHTYIAPVCKGFGISMRDVEKPKRHAINVQKGRMSDIVNQRGQTEKNDQQYARLITAAERIGIRREEYARLRSNAYGKDICGRDCVTIKGKGGKIQHQRILPEDRAAVKQLFDGSTDKVFSRKEMQNHIDLHAIRRDHAQRCYDYYAAKIKAGGADRLRRELVETFRAYHYDGKNPERMAKFQSEIDRAGGVYRLRGDNIDRARDQGQKCEFNRLALMCVSVWHLAHWRLDVTVRNYML